MSIINGKASGLKQLELKVARGAEGLNGGHEWESTRLEWTQPPPMGSDYIQP